jgi:hypothetical protein
MNPSPGGRLQTSVGGGESRSHRAQPASEITGIEPPSNELEPPFTREHHFTHGTGQGVRGLGDMSAALGEPSGDAGKRRPGSQHVDAAGQRLHARPDGRAQSI